MFDLEMNMFLAVVMLPVGLLILVKGADFLVEGAVSLARMFGISPLIIGLTIVAMGTSAPEVAASITSALQGKGNMAVGNVYGSNIANLALVGGLCALIRPIAVKLSVLRREMPIMLGVAILMYPVMRNLQLGAGESFVLLGLFVCVIGYTIYNGLKQSGVSQEQAMLVDEHIQDEHPKKNRPLGICALFIFLGLVGLTLGARFTVESASFIGLRAGMSEAVVGLTIVAIGTSLPELMTCMLAAFKGHDDISIGNLVGSNVFNTLLVVGAAGAVKPFAVDGRFAGVDYLIMVGVSAVFILLAMSKKRIGRVEGAVLVCGYFVYIFYLFAVTPGQ